MTFHEHLLDWPLEVQLAFLKNHRESTSKTKKKLQTLLFNRDPKSGIIGAFVWQDTPEGHVFWQQLHLKAGGGP